MDETDCKTPQIRHILGMQQPFHGGDEGSNPSGDIEENADRPSGVAENVAAPRREVVLYIGKASDLYSRLTVHPRVCDLYALLHSAPRRARGLVEPIVRTWEGDPDEVEGALRARYGMPAWNTKPIRRNSAPLVEYVTLRGAAAWRLDLARQLECVSGGYAIGIVGALPAMVLALAKRETVVADGVLVELCVELAEAVLDDSETMPAWRAGGE